MTMRKRKVTKYFESLSWHDILAVRGVRRRNFERVPAQITAQLLKNQEGQGKLLGIGTDVGALLAVMRKAERRWLVRHGVYEPVPKATKNWDESGTSPPLTPPGTRYTRRRKFEEATDLDILRLTRAQVRRERQAATRLKHTA